METIETDNDEVRQDYHAGDDQPPVSMSEEVTPRPEDISPPEQPSTQVCPYCQQEHPVGTLFCPVTGKPLTGVPLVSTQPEQPPIHPTTPAYYSPPYPPQPYNSYYSQRPPKDRNIALVLEILPGLFGILGIGWIYSGKTGTGLAWLIGYLVWVAIVITAAVISGFLACFCTVPINLLCVGLSAYSLNNYTKSNRQLFG